MISLQMKDYELLALTEEISSYGEETIQETPIGTVRMALNLQNYSTNRNPLYADATYIGLTFDKNIRDNNFIVVNGEKLKVLFVNSFGRYNQIFLGK